MRREKRTVGRGRGGLGGDGSKLLNDPRMWLGREGVADQESLGTTDTKQKLILF